ISFVLLCFIIACTPQTVTKIEEFAAQPIPKEALELTGKALVDYVNQRQSFFKAEYSPEVAEYRLGNLMKAHFVKQPREEGYELTTEQLLANNSDLPENFDSRDQWKDCPSLRYIRDQTKCGSCWAVSAASVMSDRLCIHTKGKVKTMLSDTDILACCGKFCGYGCEGGYNGRAWKWATISGVVSGGRYGEKGVCMPYVFHPCGSHKNQRFYGVCPTHSYRTPACKPYCQYGYGKRYMKDKVKAKTWYYLPQKDEEAIKAEIFQRGPVHATFNVYEDFASYKGGVYIHTAGKMKGGHSVKIIGWGVENGTKYWTIANSWSEDWGENGGYFRVVRGIDNCYIESGVLAGTF
ncbi:hypothetical protein V3C99_005965, partial [Haemonchus contortus]